MSSLCETGTASWALTVGRVQERLKIPLVPAPPNPSSLTHILHLRDGDVWANESRPGLWVVSWYPHRKDHPGYPGSTTDSAHESIPTEGGADAVLEWARKRFETHDPRIIAEVMVEEGAPEDEVQALQALFDEAGAPAVVKPAIARRSAELLPWAMVLKAPLIAFLTALATKAGSDAWDALSAFVAKVYAERRRPGREDGAIRFEDDRRTVILTDRLPDAGYQQLAGGELPEDGYFVWDEATSSWRRY